MDLGQPGIRGLQLILGKRGRFIRANTTGKHIGVEGRRACESEYGAAAGIQSNDGPLLPLKGLICAPLQVPVQSEINVVDGDFLYLTENPDLLSESVHLHLLSSTATPQKRLPTLLQPEPPYVVPHAVSLFLQGIQLLRTDLAYISQEMSGGAVV